MYQNYIGQKYLGPAELEKMKKVTKIAEMTKQAEKAVEDSLGLDKISSQHLRANLAPQIDSPIVNRMSSSETLKDILKDLRRFDQLPREKQIEYVKDAIEKSTPKTKEEAFARLKQAIEVLKSMNVEVPEDMVKSLEDEIVKKFGV